MKKIISILLTIIILASMCCIGNFQAFATQSRSYNFSTNYTLTGNWRNDIVAVASAQYQKTKANLGYTEAWCANFVCDCAKLAGIPNFPFYGSCTGLIPKLQTWGGTWYSYSSGYVPQKGDLVFFSNSSNTATTSNHVGIVYSSGFNSNGSITTIEGNTGGVSSSCVNIKKRTISYSSSSYMYVMGYISLTGSSSTVTTNSTNPDSYVVPTRDIYYNSSNVMTGSDVSWIQAVLYQLGYGITIDGSFGPASKTVVKQFQSDYGLAIDGSVGPATRQKLIELWSTKSFQACDVGTDFYAYITNTAYWLYLSNDYDNVSVKSPTYLTEQIWKFERQGDNSYLIRSTSSDKCLEVEGADSRNGGNVQVFSDNGTDAQRWYFLQKGDNKYVIKSKLGNYVLDVAGGANVSGTNLQIYEPNSTDAQYFSIHKYEPPEKTTIRVETSGTNVRVSWDLVEGATRYDVYLIQSPYSWDDVKYSKQISFNMDYCDFKGVAPGNYAAFVVTKPNENSKQSAWVDFTVGYDALKPANQIEYNGHIYSLYNDVYTWEQAKTKCEDMGGHLVTVTSQEEQEVIERLIENQFCRWYFMGATNVGDGTNYKWVTGEDFSYTNWRSDSPDNNQNAEHYLMTTVRAEGYWQDTNIDAWENVIGFICEVETDDISTVASTMYNGNKYEIIDENLSWEDAKKFAEMKGGHLATITTEEESDFIHELIGVGSKHYYLLGAKGNKQSVFSWMTGEDFTYSNWADGEPNNTNSNEEYLMIYKNSGEWNDTTNYTYSSGFVIEYDNYFEYGDVNKDGVVSINDATQIQKHLANIQELKEDQRKFADVNSDGKISIRDVTYIQMYIAKIIESYPMR